MNSQIAQTTEERRTAEENLLEALDMDLSRVSSIISESRDDALPIRLIQRDGPFVEAIVNGNGAVHPEVCKALSVSRTKKLKILFGGPNTMSTDVPRNPPPL